MEMKPDNLMHSSKEQLESSNFTLVGDWSPEETVRVLAVLDRLQTISEHPLSELFHSQPTTLHKSNRPGRVGRTQGADVFLDQDWTDWTLAHELGHRWNNAWDRRPQREIQKTLRAGSWEWIKHPLRLFERSLERLLFRLGFRKRLDWRALWYHPGEAAPPCGLDRNFNASEDLAECFAAIVLPAQGRARAKKVAQKPVKYAKPWDWGKTHASFENTPRGKIIHQLLDR